MFSLVTTYWSLLLKVSTGGEDAFFVSNYNGGVIAVADGVSGYATFLVSHSCTVEESKTKKKEPPEYKSFNFHNYLLV